jgi:hypothetical protein
VQTLSGSKFAFRTNTGVLSRVGLFSMLCITIMTNANDAMIGNYKRFVNQSDTLTSTIFLLHKLLLFLESFV